MFGICPYSTVALRRTASHQSELISQVLFGEMVEIIQSKNNKWLEVRCTWDNTIGWIAANQVQILTAREFDFFNENFAFALDVFSSLMAEDHHLPITLGARLPGFDGLRCKLVHTIYNYSGQAVEPEALLPTAELLLKIAKRFLKAPFLHGGRTPLGIDSSGLCQMLFLLLGHSLPRRAANQVAAGIPIDFIEQIQPGDLAFFGNSKGAIHHVGVLLNHNDIIHCDSCVRIDKLDHFGIFNTTHNKYSHRLRIVKRIFENGLPSLKKLEIKPEVNENQQVLF